MVEVSFRLFLWRKFSKRILFCYCWRKRVIFCRRRSFYGVRSKRKIFNGKAFRLFSPKFKFLFNRIGFNLCYKWISIQFYIRAEVDFSRAFFSLNVNVTKWKKPAQKFLKVSGKNELQNPKSHCLRNSAISKQNFWIRIKEKSSGKR